MKKMGGKMNLIKVKPNGKMSLVEKMDKDRPKLCNVETIGW